VSLYPLIPAKAGTQPFSATKNTKNTNIEGERPSPRPIRHFRAFRVFRGPIMQSSGNDGTNESGVPAFAGMSGGGGVGARWSHAR
jgi:hypothetical protein